MGSTLQWGPPLNAGLRRMLTAKHTKAPPATRPQPCAQTQPVTCQPRCTGLIAKSVVEQWLVMARSSEKN